jgi:preprotein translocase subunit SecE
MSDNGKAEKMKESPLKRLVNFFKELKAETKRITWPSKFDAKKAAAVVAVFCAIYIIIIAILDFGFSNLFKVIFK